MNDINEFLDKAKEISKLLVSFPFVRIFSHNDADGIISASIIMKTFSKMNIKYHTTFLSKMDSSFIIKYNKVLSLYPVLFLDIGCNSIQNLNKFKNIIILDHHKYNNKLFKSNNIIILNPEDYGISGSFSACASSITYIISKFIDKKNINLSELAMIGIDGDRQIFNLINNIVLEDALKNDLINERYGFLLGDGNLYDFFYDSIEPLLDINGNEKEINFIFPKYKLNNKKISSLTNDEIDSFKLLVYEELKKNNCTKSIDFIFGNVYSLKNFNIKNIHDFSSLLTVMGQIKKSGIGVSVCFNNKESIIEGKELYFNFKKNLFFDLLNVYKTKKELKNVCYFYGKNISSAGEIASSISRYKIPSKIIICFNETKDNLKVSGRCLMKHISNGIDLSEAFSEASSKVGGIGGGHMIASGGIVPLGKHNEFALIVNDILEKQIIKTNPKNNLKYIV